VTSTDRTDLTALEERLRRVEDELAITKLVASYGPAADAGLAVLAASLWEDDGVYDWDVHRPPLTGSVSVGTMLGSSGHADLIASGVAHMSSAPLIEIAGDEATALTYSVLMRRDEDDRIYVWRLSAARWDLVRDDEDGWLVRRRTHRNLDGTGAGRDLFKRSLLDLYGEQIL
jgi:hypothetical protein